MRSIEPGETWGWCYVDEWHHRRLAATRGGGLISSALFVGRNSRIGRSGTIGYRIRSHHRRAILAAQRNPGPGRQPGMGARSRLK